jgi:hypothetical protein
VQEFLNGHRVDLGIVVSGLDMFDGFNLVLGHVGDAFAENTSDH